MTGILGAFAEAWDEVRVHKSRVILSLVGVFLAVFAMTTVTAIGQLAAQVQQEQAERYGGRSATVSIQAYDPMTGLPPDAAEWDAAVADLLERYDITTAATQAYEEGLFRMPAGAMSAQVRRVSPSYGPLHRVEPVEGRWFVEGDRASLSPALVVNEGFLRALGVADLSSRPTVMIGGPAPVRATIVGVVREGYGEELVVYRVDRSGLATERTGTDPGPASSAGRRHWSCGSLRSRRTRRWPRRSTICSSRWTACRWTAAAWTTRARSRCSRRCGWPSGERASWS